MTLPTTTSQWTAQPKDGLDGLKYEENVNIEKLGETSCLVKIETVSLNFRDVAILTGRYPMAFKDNVVPCSDGAGTIIAIGPRVTLHKVGDRVCTLFNQDHQAGFTNSHIQKSSLGSQLNGILREYAVLPETGLVPASRSLTMAELATLPCAALTAWNALTGIADRALQPKHYVLVQGSGGVSLSAAQFALAQSATVIATTSSDEKAARLKKLGIQHVINYNEDKNWGETAKSITDDGEGVHHVIEVGGETTMAQSLEAIRSEGVINVIGFLGGKEETPVKCTEAVLKTVSVIRGVKVGSKEQFEKMNDFIDEKGIKPIIDTTRFEYRDAKEAFQYMLDGKHWGKIVINVRDN